MKNLDIEKLERKNIYTTPDNFFEKVQANVLMETVHKIKPQVQEKTIAKAPQKQWWIAAAAVALIFGLGFFLNNDKEVTPQIAQTEQLPIHSEAATLKAEENSAVTADGAEKENFVEPAKSLTFAENKNQTITPKVVVVESKTTSNKNGPAKVKKEEQFDQVLASFTNEELAMLSKNMEQDVYLDLYN